VRRSGPKIDFAGEVGQQNPVGATSEPVAVDRDLRDLETWTPRVVEPRVNFNLIADLHSAYPPGSRGRLTTTWQRADGRSLPTFNGIEHPTASDLAPAKSVQRDHRHRACAVRTRCSIPQVRGRAWLVPPRDRRWVGSVMRRCPENVTHGVSP